MTKYSIIVLLLFCLKVKGQTNIENVNVLINGKAVKGMKELPKGYYTYVDTLIINDEKYYYIGEIISLKKKKNIKKKINSTQH